MSALALSVVLQLAATPACTVPGMLPEFWSALMDTESAHDPLALHDDDTGRPYHPHTTQEAEALATALLTAGHSVGLGLTQLTARSVPQFEVKFGITIHEAFEPCINMQAGARHFVRGALSTYNCGRPTCSGNYALRVERIAAHMPPVMPVSAAAPPPPPSVFAKATSSRELVFPRQ